MHRLPRSRSWRGTRAVRRSPTAPSAQFSTYPGGDCNNAHRLPTVAPVRNSTEPGTTTTTTNEAAAAANRHRMSRRHARRSAGTGPPRRYRLEDRRLDRPAHHRYTNPTDPATAPATSSTPVNRAPLQVRAELTHRAGTTRPPMGRSTALGV